MTTTTSAEDREEEAGFFGDFTRAYPTQLDGTRIGDARSVTGSQQLYTGVLTFNVRAHDGVPARDNIKLEIRLVHPDPRFSGWDGASFPREPLFYDEGLGLKYAVVSCKVPGLTDAEEVQRKSREVQGSPGRVAPGDCSPGAPTDPYVQDYLILCCRQHNMRYVVSRLML